ncbi:MAG: Conserved rane protein of unknown function [Rhodospirillales bacterium]|nr:Conserved rane protein of unknown function [Rhodospirillales bacterium]
MTATNKPGSYRRTVALAFLALALLALVPVATVKLPPILDYPNHMARMYILAALPGTPDLAKFYRVVWTPLPDLAFDAVVPWLARLMPVDIAMRLSLGFMLLALAGGCMALHRAAFGRLSIWPLFAFLLLYNRILLWGFFNYLAGLAVMLWALAAWVALERKPLPWRIGIGVVLATAVYLAHLAAFGCYALAIMVLAVVPHREERFTVDKAIRRVLPALVTLLPGIVLFLLAPTSGASTHFGYGNPLRKFDLPVSIFDNYNRIFDGATFGVLLIAVIAGLIKHNISLHHRLRWSLLAVLIAFFLVPSRLLSASGIDHRLPIAIALLFVATSDWGAVSNRNRQIITAALFVLLLVRLAVIETVWLRADRTYDALRPMFDQVAPGATIAVAAPASEVQAGGVPLYHFPTLAIIRRNAFVDTIFADPLQQPVQLTGAAHSLWANQVTGDLWQAAANGALPSLAGYDDLIIVDPPKGLDTSKLGGTVLFAAPRMVVVHLSTPAPFNIEQPPAIEYPQ